MREAKTIIVTGVVVVLVLLVAGLGYTTLSKSDNQTVSADGQLTIDQQLTNLRKSIRQLTVVEEDQRLRRDILQHQQDIRRLQLEAQASPVDDLPEDVDVPEN